MRTGDIVYHRPSGEEWLVAWADPRDGYMAPCGWPTCQARIADCEIIQRADDETCNRLIDELAKSGRTDDAEEMGEGPPASEWTAHWQKLHAAGRAALEASDEQ